MGVVPVSQLPWKDSSKVPMEVAHAGFHGSSTRVILFMEIVPERFHGSRTFYSMEATPSWATSMDIVELDFHGRSPCDLRGSYSTSTNLYRSLNSRGNCSGTVPKEKFYGRSLSTSMKVTRRASMEIKVNHLPWNSIPLPWKQYSTRIGESLIFLIMQKI